MSGILPDSDDRAGRRSSDRVEHGRLGRDHREILAVVGPLPLARTVADKRPRDHPSDVIGIEDLPRDLAAAMQFRDGDDALVSRDLEDRVAAGVDDPVAGAHVLGRQFLEDHGAGSRLVAEDTAPGPLPEGGEDLLGKPVRKDRERLVDEQAGHLPVPGRRVFSRRRLAHLAVRPRRHRRGRHAEDGREVAEPVLLQVRQGHPADESRGVAEGVRADVAVIRGVRQLATADGIHHEHDRALHVP